MIMYQAMQMTGRDLFLMDDEEAGIFVSAP